MTESQFYSRYLRPALYRPPTVQVFRVEDYGIPDVLVVSGGITYFLELKTLDHLPVREGTPFRVKGTIEQRRTMQQIDATGKYHRAFFLVAVAREKMWFLFPSDVPEELDDPYEWALDAGSFDDLPGLIQEEE